jgi:hypothetical protein
MADFNTSDFLKEENTASVGNTLHILTSATGLFSSLKESAIGYDNNLTLLIDDINTNGVTVTNKDCYDKYQLLFLQSLNTLLATKFANPNGVGAKIIRPISPTKKQYNVSISYKLQDYSWITNKPICPIDNMTVSNTLRKISIGCIDIILLDCDDFASNYSYFGIDPILLEPAEFVEGIAAESKKIHDILSMILKNITTIDSSIKFVNNLIEVHDLY